MDGTQGTVVAEAEITILAEHMFYDRLGTHKGVFLRFDTIASAVGIITPEGLASQRLTDLRGCDGQELRDARGHPVVYLPGAYDVRRLLEFITRSIVDQAHLNGRGVAP